MPLFRSGKFAAHYVGLSRATTIERMGEPMNYNSVTLLQRPLKAEHFSGWCNPSKPEFKQFELIRDEYDRLKALPVNRVHDNDSTLLV